MIDWSKLKPYRGYSWKSFEELCYQLAKGLYSDKGRFTPIDDSGGGDGVEFYLTMHDGREWGWQAKFYYPNPRLRVSGRKTSIKNSLKRAIRNHKRLEKWFLCTPTNFTNSENEWFEKLQKKYPNVILEHWSESDFNDIIRNPRFIGIKNHFFGELELSIEWFHTQVKKQVANVGNKFIPNLHTETKVDLYIHTLLGDSVFRQHLKEQIKDINDNISYFEEAIDELRETYNRIGLEDIRNKLLTYSNQLRKSFIEITKALNDTNEYLSSGLFKQIEQIDWNSLEKELTKRLDNYSTAVQEFEPEKLQYKGSDEERKNFSQYIRQKSYEPLSFANEIASLFYIIKRDINLTIKQDLHIFGGAGIGKTHIACNLSQDRVENGLPAILLLGKHFTGNFPLEKQILQILDIPSSYSWEDFIKTFQSAAEAYKTNIPIIIDALNEAQNINIWKRELPGFAYVSTALPQVILITTCRSNYRQVIWQTSKPQNTIETYGFGPDSLEEAITKYFEWYKIKCDFTLAPLKQFSHPIFLKMFCESQNRERSVEKEIYLGEQTLLKVFEDYINQSNEIVCSKLSKHPSAHIAQNSLKELAKELWERKSLSIPLSDAVKLIDSKDIEEIDWPNSITYAILDEGLLINRDLINSEDAVLFTYNLLGGYLIVKEIIDNLAPEKIEAFVKSERFENYLLSDNFSDRHPLHEDILGCFAILLPMRFGKHLYQLTDDQEAFNYSIRALFEMEPELIDDNSEEFIVKLFSHPENRKPLLKLAQTTVTQVGHPLNIEFWDELLIELSLPERDLNWTEFVRRNASNFINELDKLESACKEVRNFSQISKKRLLLAAKFYRWLLTSTVREIRDTATRALYWYGRRFSDEFFDLVMNSLSINDPYVPERMLAASYGVAMALQYDLSQLEFREKILPVYAKKVYNAMFKPEAPHSTTHILSRDYAKRLIDIALIHNSNILTSEEKQRITPPFVDGGIRNWGESEERDKDKYREGSGPIHMDFANYTLGRLVPNRSNYDFNHEDYKKVRANICWRLYELGYSHNVFKEIDKEIHRYNWSLGRAANGKKIDRYGKKHSWIAFYELAGYRQDNGLLPEYYSERNRISDADIDPSFPEPPQEFEVIKTDYLGDRSLDVTEWIEKGGVPDLTPYLIVERLFEEYGPWVLFDGYINQEDLESNRARFIFPRGLLVKKDEALKIVECLEGQNLGGRWLPEILGDYYTYAGEIPWCETLLHNGEDKLDFIVSSKVEKVAEKGVIKLSNGTILTFSELLVLLFQKKLDMTSKENIEDFLDEEGIKQIETLTYRDKEIKKTKSYEVLLPVRYYNWEGYHSTLNRAGNSLVPAKEIAEALDLCSQPQTFNLYEKKGKQASITLRWGEPWHTEHHLIYLRQDLLENYLNEKNAEFVWAIWGQREFKSKEIKELEDFSKEHESYRVFQTIETYSKIKNTASN